jgi:hypothetical protein
MLSTRVKEESLIVPFIFLKTNRTRLERISIPKILRKTMKKRLDKPLPRISDSSPEDSIELVRILIEKVITNISKINPIRNQNKKR